jgi:hypothetical protein
MVKTRWPTFNTGNWIIWFYEYVYGFWIPTVLYVFEVLKLVTLMIPTKEKIRQQFFVLRERKDLFVDNSRRGLQWMSENQTHSKTGQICVQFWNSLFKCLDLPRPFYTK